MAKRMTMNDENQAQTEGSSIQKPQDVMERLNNFQYEAAAAKQITTAAHAAGIRRKKRLTGHYMTNDRDLVYTLEDAADDDLITIQEAREIINADVIALGQDRNTKDPAYLVIEAAENISQADVLHAANRARLLQKATGTPARPVVIGGQIGDDIQRLATRKEWSRCALPCNPRSDNPPDQTPDIRKTNPPTQPRPERTPCPKATT